MADFSTQFHRFVALCTEEYLIKYANKGLYNRAQKELEKGVQVTYEFQADQVTCTLDDGTVCELTDDIERFRCTCPSDKICKHVLIAILSYHRQEGIDAQVPTADFSWILTQPIDTLCRHFTESQIDEVLFRIHYEEELAITQGAFLTVTLTFQGVEVSFLEEADIAKSMCSCKEKAGCIHRLEALIRYRIRHGVTDFETLHQHTADVTYSADVVSDTRTLIAQIATTGLAKLPQSVCDRLEVLAIAAHNGNLPNLEREIRGINGELGLFFKRHVRFSKDLFRKRLTRAYMNLEALEQKTATVEQKAQLLGRFKSRYYPIPRLLLYALGANPWETRSAYKGITYYFYSPDDGCIYTYTEARPVYYEDVSFLFADQYAKRSTWNYDLTMKQIASAQLVATICKVNRERRLSSSEETSIAIKPRMRIEDVELGELVVTDWAQVRSKEGRQLFTDRREQLMLLKASHVAETRFEQKTQNFLIMVEDAGGNYLSLTIPYNKEWAGSVRFLEKSRELLGLRDFYILAQQVDDAIEPISLLKDASLSNLKLDF
ncbi:hypothetical protein EDM56_06635 [Brevibacillus fluminis]|uniref:SWIM-type domain-containing protein n=1 Tax=Brevibacillus fluminis TaxID=511487 RepID=A0A3M8DT37_9BACL|nr:SWIM zinc finger family protein [Brevibacillus fluminis]RNB91252.1 hypothetical protein EDM56_06635 [Brevibacillus fluminis]